jgi:hypothetical protein
MTTNIIVLSITSRTLSETIPSPSSINLSAILRRSIVPFVLQAFMHGAQMT